MKRLLCYFLGHKSKAQPPLKYWVEGKGAVDSPFIAIFCSRCGEGLLQITWDEINKTLVQAIARRMRRYLQHE